MTDLEVENVGLDYIRKQLIRQEETIIFALIERSSFARNLAIYTPKSVSKAIDETYLEYFLCETEKLHARMGRYDSIEEYAFYSQSLSQWRSVRCTSQAKFHLLIKSNSICYNNKILKYYVEHVPELICEDGDDFHYGSSATADIVALQALSRRIHFGKFVAEVKFREKPEEYSELIRNRDSCGLMKLLTNEKVEEKLLERVRLKASTYGENSVVRDNAEKLGDAVVEFYKAFIIPATKEIEVEYLLERLGPLRIAYAGECGSQIYFATKKKFIKNAEEKVECPVIEGLTSTEEVFGKVFTRQCNYGVVELESSITGTNQETLVHLKHYNAVKVCGEIVVEDYYILASKNPSLPTQDVIVVGQKQQLGFCSLAISSIQDKVKVNETINIINMISNTEDDDNKRYFFLISPKLAEYLKLYIYSIKGSEIISSHDNLLNCNHACNRYLVISKSYGCQSGIDKSMFLFTVSNMAGSLCHVLHILKDFKINMTALYSFPSVEGDQSITYSFYVEVDGHVDSSIVGNCLNEISKIVRRYQIIGAFPNTSGSPLLLDLSF
eukprot:GHVL01044983.1.p1 GENE.GHVL01044983.1~~GHVL01044983.1.p1  ORF type:complete len:554 (+),score=112.24 GHVL01044983.1:100-1761(+)